MNRPFHIGLLCAAALSVMTLSGGCTSGITSAAEEVNPSGWPAGQAVQAVFPNNDTLSLREIEVFMVCTGKLGRDSLELFLTTITPDSLTVTEKIVMYPAETDNARYRQITRPYRGKVLLDKTGEYRFEFRHRYAYPLVGIKAVGVNVKNDASTI